MSVTTESSTIKGAVVNVIPPQKAGKIAFDAGLVQGNWAPVNKATFESEKVPGVHVLGDAAVAATMPKSGYAANSQAKVCAAAVAAALNGKTAPTPSYVNTCYSIAAKDHAFSVAAVYTYDDELNEIEAIKEAKGLSPLDASDEVRKREAQYAHSWYKNVVQDIWG
jgi:sulfide dehydrogenase [flavocytochrome c] flavoprotein subunit